uniref:Uncharacterized protein n=1 Tax=Ascaris lumbricoides TaxID=6252 RepID=A0A0M3IBZ2_ASCLU
MRKGLPVLQAMFSLAIESGSEIQLLPLPGYPSVYYFVPQDDFYFMFMLLVSHPPLFDLNVY